MTDETKNEMIKAFAYGKTAEVIAEVEGISLEEAQTFETCYASDIEDRKTFLKEMGWM